MFEKFIHQTPFLRFVLPLIVGIVIKINLPNSHFPVVFISLILLLLIIILQISKQSQKFLTNRIWSVLISFFIFLTGISLVQFKQQKQFNFHNKQYTYIAKIIETPEVKEKSVKAVLELESFKDSIVWVKNNSKILAYFQKDSASNNLEPGDQILINSYINEIKHSGNPNAFNYKNYLKYKEVYSQVYIKSEQHKTLDKGKISFLKLFSNKLRNKLLKIYLSNNITGDEFAVLSALTLGYKNDLTPELKESFSTSGAMHVLAVSGLHVGIIFIILSKLLFFLERRKHGKYLQSGIIIISLFFYAALTGLSDSVMRATIMFSFISIGKMFTRQVSIYNSLCASAFIMLLYNPYSIMNVGFQLSYLAVISIVFFQPKIYAWIQFKYKVPDYIWQLITVAIAAQIGTFPLTIYYFNQFPLYFILSNIAIIPIVSLIIYGAILIFITSFSATLSSFISQIILYLTKLLNYNVRFIESLPYSKVDNVILNVPTVILLIITIISISFFIISKRIRFFRIAIILLILTGSFSIIDTLKKSSESLFIVYNTPGLSSLNFIVGNNSQLHTNDEITNNQFEYNISPFLQNQKIKKSANKHINTKQLFISYQFKNKRIINLQNDSILSLKPQSKLNTNYIVLSNNVNLKISELCNYFQFDKIIFDSSNSYYKTTNWIKQCKELGINFHCISDNGAFIEYL